MRGASLASAAAAAPARLAAPPATQTLPARLPDGVRPRAAHGDVDDTLAEPLLASELLPCQRAVVDEAPDGCRGRGGAASCGPRLERSLCVARTFGRGLALELRAGHTRAPCPAPSVELPEQAPRRAEMRRCWPHRSRVIPGVTGQFGRLLPVLGHFGQVCTDRSQSVALSLSM